MSGTKSLVAEGLELSLTSEVEQKGGLGLRRLENHHLKTVETVSVKDVGEVPEMMVTTTRSSCRLISSVDRIVAAQQKLGIHLQFVSPGRTWFCVPFITAGCTKSIFFPPFEVDHLWSL